MDREELAPPLQHRSTEARSASLRRDLNATRKALYRSTAARHLIELGGLVVKAGLVELTDDDRAMLYGAFLWIAGKLQSDDAAHASALWRRKGKRAFEADTLLGKDGPVIGAP